MFSYIKREEIKRDARLDLIRDLACIAVLVMHTVALFWYKVPVKLLSNNDYQIQIEIYRESYDVTAYLSDGYYLCSFIDALTRFSVPIFVMISGALVLNRSSIPNRYVLKKIFYIARIIVLWGSVLALLIFILKKNMHAPISVSYIIQTAINGAGVFWFLYMILFLYIASPIFKVISDNQQARNLFITIWFITSILWPTMVSFFPSLSDNIKFEYIQLFSLYTGYFVMGGSLCNDKIPIPDIGGKFLIVLCAVCVILISLGTPPGWFHNFANPLCVLYTVAVFLLLKQIKIPQIAERYVITFAKYTMPIYALHPFFIQMVSSIWPIKQSCWIIQMPVYIIAVLIFSYGTAYVIKKLPFFRSI